VAAKSFPNQDVIDADAESGCLVPSMRIQAGLWPRSTRAVCPQAANQLAGGRQITRMFSGEINRGGQMSSVMLARRHQWCENQDMRTTVRLDPDVAAAAEQLRRERHIGLGEAINELARAGMRARPSQPAFRQRTRAMGLRVDVSNVAEALELLDASERAG
jgi:hypothetical protein